MKRLCIMLLFSLLMYQSASAQSYTSGVGLIRTPTAELQNSRNITTALHYQPREIMTYTHKQRDVAMFSFNTTIFPFLELSWRFDRPLGEANMPHPKINWMPNLILRLIKERLLLPAIAVGMNDYLSTFEDDKRHMGVSYLVLSKVFPIDGLRMTTSIGYARQLFEAVHYDFEGFFGGVRLHINSLPLLDIILEHDSFRMNAGIEFNISPQFEAQFSLMDGEYPAFGLVYSFLWNQLLRI